MFLKSSFSCQAC